MRTITSRPAILLAAIVLAAAACGDDDGVNLLDAASTEATAETPSSPAEGDTTSAPGGGVSPEIQVLLDRFDRTPLRTVYRFDEPPGGQIVTLSQDPSRSQSATLLGPDGTEGKIITTGDLTIVCSPAGEAAQCFEAPAGAGLDATGGLFSPLIAGFLLTEGITEAPGFSVEQQGATIAGRSGVCFTYTPRPFIEADLEFVRQCIDAELGFTLLIQGRDSGSDTVQTFMELVEFGQPRPGDFEPTGPVTELPQS